MSSQGTKALSKTVLTGLEWALNWWVVDERKDIPWDREVQFLDKN